METLVQSTPFTGYVYPNETMIPWTVLIVVYPYLTGLVAGAFTISSLYQVFGFLQLRPPRIRQMIEDHIRPTGAKLGQG